MGRWRWDGGTVGIPKVLVGRGRGRDGVEVMVGGESFEDVTVARISIETFYDSFYDEGEELRETEQNGIHDLTDFCND